MSKPDKSDKAPRTDPNERMKKIGDRLETITVKLTPPEIEDEKGIVCDLLGRKSNLQAGLKSVKTDYKAKLDSLDEKISAAHQAAMSGQRVVEIDVEEWLTRGNEIVRVRLDTGEIIGRRTARMDELQEALFPEPAAAGEGFPSSDQVFGAPS